MLPIRPARLHQPTDNDKRDSGEEMARYLEGAYAQMPAEQARAEMRATNIRKRKKWEAEAAARSSAGTIAEVEQKARELEEVFC